MFNVWSHFIGWSKQTIWLIWLFSMCRGLRNISILGWQRFCIWMWHSRDTLSVHWIWMFYSWSTRIKILCSGSCKNASCRRSFVLYGGTSIYVFVLTRQLAIYQAGGIALSVSLSLPLAAIRQRNLQWRQRPVRIFVAVEGICLELWHEKCQSRLSLEPCILHTDRNGKW